MSATITDIIRGAHTLSGMATAHYEEARDKLATFLHAQSRNKIMLTTGATESINLIHLWSSTPSTWGRNPYH